MFDAPQLFPDKIQTLAGVILLQIVQISTVYTIFPQSYPHLLAKY